MKDPDESLEERFSRFAGGLAGAELVDALPLTEAQRQAKKVDFFFDRRSIVCEMKSLTTDVTPKVERILDPHRDRDEFPGFYGKWPIDSILARLPDGKEIQAQLYHAITSGIADLVGEANRQIRKTKEFFALCSARGVLIILNDSVALLDPRTVAHRVYQTLMKRTPDGQPRFPEIGAVWIVGETHRVRLTDDLVGIPGIILAHPLKPDEEALTFLSDLQKPWAEFTGLPLVEVAESAYEALQYVDLAPEDHDSGVVNLSELWRREYGRHPYLVQLSDTDLIFYGARLSVELTIIQKNPMAARRAILRSTRRWSDLNEELNRRRIDVWDVRRLAAAEGMRFDESAEFWEHTKLIADDCDVRIET